MARTQHVAKPIQIQEVELEGRDTHTHTQTAEVVR